MRIVSLVPSITATLFDFGLKDDEIIGRTKFCIHPKDLVKKVPIIGGTKNINIEKIRLLNPDLIIASKEENVKEQVEELMKTHKVWVTDITNLKDHNNFLEELGGLLDKTQIAQEYIAKTNKIFTKNKPSIEKEVIYLIWKNPYMTVGSDTFIHDILVKIGFKNKFDQHTRYPQITEDDLHNCEYILLSSEPYPFSEKHLEDLQQKFPAAKVIMVDGEAFSWYGTHITKFEGYFKSLREW